MHPLRIWSLTFRLTTVFVWKEAAILFQERGAYNILLWFCLTCHPSCETIRASSISLAWVAVSLSSCTILLLRPFVPRAPALHYGANPMSDVKHLHLPMTSMGVESVQHLAESGPFCCVVKCCSQSARKDLLRSGCGLILVFWHMPTAVT